MGNGAWATGRERVGRGQVDMGKWAWASGHGQVGMGELGVGKWGMGERAWGKGASGQEQAVMRK